MAPDARRARIAPDPRPDWEWQRYLTGQVLPLAALLQGLEVFHAAVVERQGAAVAVVAGSGVGKTTVALELVRRGLGFLADDVLVVEPAPGGPLALPAVGLANVRGSEGPPGDLEREGLASRVGSNERETRISLELASGPCRLAALVILSATDDAEGVEVERLTPVDPRLLLAASFNFAIQTPERLTRQLDVCSQLSLTVPVFRVARGRGAGAAAVAEAILSRALPG
jgi:hypothetical protein